MRLLTCSIASLLVLSVPVDLAVGASGPQPFELVRELQIFQDQAAQKTNNARAEQKSRISDVAAQLSKFDASVWTEPRNARAAVIYVLSGGDPSVLRNLVKSGAALAIDDRLVKGALAYGERHDAEAIE
jgi:chemotaxis protein MotC